MKIVTKICNAKVASTFQRFHLTIKRPQIFFCFGGEGTFSLTNKASCGYQAKKLTPDTKVSPSVVEPATRRLKKQQTWNLRANHSLADQVK